MITVVGLLVPSQRSGSCAVGYTVPAMKKLWQLPHASPGRMVGPVPDVYVFPLVHTSGVL